MMKKLWSVLAVCALAPPLVVTAQGDVVPAAEHEQHLRPPGDAATGEHSMPAMHEHMREMREQMARIQAAEDPVERQRLMHEHMQSMQQHMQMMGSMRAEQQAGSASRCAEGDAMCRMDEMRAENGMMGQRMRMLEDRLESMQQLMQQMMDHLDEAQSADSGRR
jgi:periplasmic protein CpxP/Spy